MKTLRICIVFAVATTGCASVSRNGQRIYSPSDIVHNAAALKGRQVRVSGHLVLGQDTRSLWDSLGDEQEAARGHHSLRDPIWDRCITAYYDLSIAQLVRRASSSDVEVVGTVGDNRSDRRGVDLWACNDVYITIHAVRNSTASTTHQIREGAADRLPPPASSSDDENLIPSSPVRPKPSPNPPSDQSVQPQVEQLGLQVAATPPR